MQKQFNSIIFLLLGLIAGIGGSVFFSADNTPALICASKTQQSAAGIKIKSAAIETHYQGKLDSLQQTNTALKSRITSTKSELQQTKQDNKILLELVDTLIAHAGNTKDTAEKLADCDTLQSAVTELMAVTYQKDSLYEDLATALQCALDNKDSTIEVQQQAYNSLKLFLDNSLAQQDMLASQNMLYQKQISRHKVKNKLLSAVVLILTGIATYGLLPH